MNNFIISIEAVIPMFSMLMIGVIVRRLKILNDTELTHVNAMVFKTLFPILMFNNTYNIDLSEVMDLKLIIFAVSLVLSIYFFALLFVLKIEKNNKKRGAMIQAIYRSNFVIMGLPVAINLAGEGNVGATTILIAIIVPLYNVLAVITLESFRGSKVNFKKVLKGVAKNPLILGTLVGLIFSIFSINISKVLEKTISQISAAATPMALIVLGASFNLKSIEKEYKSLIICIMGRLIVVPGIALSIAALVGIRGIGFISLIGIFASPCAVSSYTMAQQMDSDGVLAGNTVIFTSAIASFTLFLWIFLFKQLGMF